MYRVLGGVERVEVAWRVDAVCYKLHNSTPPNLPVGPCMPEETQIPRVSRLRLAVGGTVRALGLGLGFKGNFKGLKGGA